MMPIGSALGGLIVAVSEPLFGREWALRAPFLTAAALTFALFAYALPRLNSAKIEEAKADGGDRRDRPPAGTRRSRRLIPGEVAGSEPTEV